MSISRRFPPYALWSGLLLAMIAGGCGKEESSEPERKAGKAIETQPAEVPNALDTGKLLSQSQALFGSPLPARADTEQNPMTEAKVDLGRMLYFDTRLSKNQDISCNSCHSLSDYGIDVRGEPDKRQTSAGHKGQMGDRNSPTVYNAALHFRQFWDGRAADVEEQAKGPVLNPVEMSMADDAAVVAVIKSIPGYVEAFKAAFPDAKDPITYDNIAIAIASFERGLLTPSRFDQFLAGKIDALTAEERSGLKAFIDTGCTACHLGQTVGGTMYQKLGLIKPYETKDEGRYKESKIEAEKFFFKVPSLRNIDKTGPYLHDGSIASLEEMVRIMGEHQTASGKLDSKQIASIVTFLKTLTGDLPTAYIVQPELPASGPKTPKPDPS